MNSTLDVLSGAALGAYLIAVAVHGNSSTLLAYATQDKAFLKWALAVAILYWLYGMPELKGPVSLLIAAAFIGLAFTSGANIGAQAKTFWASLG